MHADDYDGGGDSSSAFISANLRDTTLSAEDVFLAYRMLCCCGGEFSQSDRVYVDWSWLCRWWRGMTFFSWCVVVVVDDDYYAVIQS